jgi:peptide/nickel transport system substrate-binding protein
VVLLLAGCTATATDTESPAAQGGGGAPATAAGGAEDLTLAIGRDEGSLTAFTYVTGYPGFNLLGLVYDSLLVLDEDNRLQPLLAESVESDEQGRTWTVRLRDGIRFHDGEPLTSANVAFTYRYVRDNPVVARFTSAVAPIDRVETPDDTTAVIHLAEPDPTFADDALGPLVDVPILPEHLWAEIDDPAAAGVDLAVGTGPYRLVEHVPDQRYRFEANSDYALGTPAVQRLTLAVIPEPRTALAALTTGEIDASAVPLDAQSAGEVEQRPGIEVAHGPGFGSVLLQLNTERPPLDQPAARQAISLAIDVDELVDTVLLGAGTPGNPGFLHPESPVGLEPAEHEYDPERAAELLDELGYTPGPDGVRARDGRPLSFTLLVRADNPTRIRTAELIAGMLADVGVQVTVEALESETLDERVWPGFDVAKGRDFALAVWGWSATTMLSGSRLGQLVHSDPARGIYNIGGLRDPGLDALVDDVDAAATADQRRDRLQALHDAIADRPPFVTLFYDDLALAYRPESYDGWRFQSGQGIVTKLSLVQPGA